MSSDIYCKVDLSENIRYTKREQENTAEWEEREVNIYESAEEFTHNNIVSQPEEEDQQANRQPAVERSSARRAKLCNILPWSFISAAIIILTTYLILDMNKVKNGYDKQHVKLSEMAANNSQLKESYNILIKQYDQLKDEINRLNYTIKETWCPDGWTRFQCSCYFTSEEKKYWSESRKYCQERGGDLVIIKSNEEQEFVKNLNRNQESWIGLEGKWLEGKIDWRWVDGSTLTQS
ncbi:PREDICTED: CD209 antigen-like [Cyprinodon variegatus]|uniref:CD209 antigen-like n=1 Tax=Cyprinodon variegatus TaxID=28743 RepID=UPI0007428810|nr:PREDICTED: CD209 antigen-like [Cyprinodon variegatus]